MFCARKVFSSMKRIHVFKSEAGVLPFVLFITFLTFYYWLNLLTNEVMTPFNTIICHKTFYSLYLHIFSLEKQTI